jgi:hypothetical protein
MIEYRVALVSAKDAYFSVGFVKALNKGKADKRSIADSVPQRRSQRRCGYR